MRLTLIFLLMLISALSASGQTQSAVIVAQVTLTNQTAYIPPTRLVMPKSNALYRISAYIEALGQNQTQCDEYLLNLGWTDATPQGSKQVIFAKTYNCSSPEYDQRVMIVSDLSGKPLGYSVTDTNGVAPTEPFNVYITVEQLQ